MKTLWLDAAVIAAVVLFLFAIAPEAKGEEGWTIHTVSAHVGWDEANNINPGLAYETTDGWRFGGYYNSYKLPSVYAAKVIPINDRWRYGIGVVTGYKFDSEQFITGSTSGAIPFVALEFDVTEHVSIITLANAISLEIKF